MIVRIFDWPAEQPGVLPALGHVHVWRIDLDQPGVACASPHGLLDEEECRRAFRFRQRQARERFIAAHGVCRLVLGRYLALPPGELRLVRDAGGKPRLAGSPPPGDLEFSLTHCDGAALLAVTVGQDVGVDLERESPQADAQSPRLDVREIATRFFPRRRAQRLASIRPDRRRKLFLRYWTRMEAAAKAAGTGISVAFGNGLPLCRWRPRPQVRRLRLEPGWVGAVALLARISSQ